MLMVMPFSNVVPTDGYDLNRDQSKLEDAVTLLLKQSYQQWNPDVALDIHEYTPLRREFNLLRGVPTANAADVLFTYRTS